MSRRPTRLTLLALGIALPTALLGVGWFTASLRERGMKAAAQRQRLVHSAEAIRAAVDESLEDLRRREDARPFYLYNHYYSPPELLALNDPIAVSPLAAAPDDRRVRGYFQVDPAAEGAGHTVRTPYEPIPETTRAADKNDDRGVAPSPPGSPQARAAELYALVMRDGFSDIRAQSFGDAGAAPGRMPPSPVEAPPDTLIAQAVPQQAPLTTSLNAWGNIQQQDIVEAQKGDLLANERVQKRGRQAPQTSRNSVSWGELEQQQLQQRKQVQQTNNKRPAQQQAAAPPKTRPDPPEVAPGPAQVVDYTPMRFAEVDGAPLLYRVVSHAGTGSVQGVVLDRVYIEQTWLPALLERHLADEDDQALRPSITRDAGTCALALPISTKLPELMLCYPSGADEVAGLDTSLLLQTGALLGLLAVIATAGFTINRASREAEELAAQRAAFVSAVSHELRTPLTTVRMHAEMLREGLVSPERRARVHDELTRETVRLTRLIDNVLTVSRLEAGRHALELAEGELSSQVERVVESQRDRVERAGFELIVRVPEEPVIARYDAQAIEQIVINLIDNALKYAGGDDARARELAVELTRAGAGVAELHVRDRGPGIPDSARRRVFERFFRVKRPEDSHLPGTGLGLSLVHDLARAHGGDARVGARPGGGADFCITLPCEPAA